MLTLYTRSTIITINYVLHRKEIIPLLCRCFLDITFAFNSQVKADRISLSICFEFYLGAAN